MIVRTSQQQNAGNCCGCPVTACAEPRKQCEQVANCGFDIGSPVGSNIAQRLKRYKIQTDTIGFNWSEYIEADYDPVIYQDRTHTESTTVVFEKVSVGGVCTIRPVSGVSNITTTEHNTGSGGSFYDNVTTWDWTAGPSGVISGTYLSTTTNSDGVNPPVVTTDTSVISGTMARDGTYSNWSAAATFTRTELIYSSGVNPYKTFTTILSLINDPVFPYPPTMTECESLNSIAAGGIHAKYRFGVPVDFSTVELPRSTWEMQWDEVTASADWWAWFDGGMTGTEPTPGPTLAASKSWTWGGDMESPWSDWHALPIPEIEGETRTANVMVRCYNSARLGSKPTASGDQIGIAEISGASTSPSAGEDGNPGNGASVGNTGRTGLRINGVRMSGTEMTGLRMSGPEMTGLRMSGLRASGLRPSTGVRVGNLESSGGLRSSGLRVSGVRSSTGTTVSSLRVSGVRPSSGLRRSSGLRASGLR